MGGCELSDAGAVNWTWVLWESRHTHNHWSMSLTPPFLLHIEYLCVTLSRSSFCFFWIYFFFCFKTIPYVSLIILKPEPCNFCQSSLRSSWVSSIFNILTVILTVSKIAHYKQYTVNNFYETGGSRSQGRGKEEVNQRGKRGWLLELCSSAVNSRTGHYDESGREGEGEVVQLWCTWGRVTMRME